MRLFESIPENHFGRFDLPISDVVIHYEDDFKTDRKVFTVVYKTLKPGATELRIVKFHVPTEMFYMAGITDAAWAVVNTATYVAIQMDIERFEYTASERSAIIDDLMERWHLEYEGPDSLGEFLGFTPEQDQHWAQTAEIPEDWNPPAHLIKEAS